MSDEAAVPRHYGDPRAEYRAATEEVALLDLSDRARWVVEGRDPARMMDGILTNRVPPLPEPVAGEDVLAGRALYSAVLTPKGKMITDLRTWWRGPEEEHGLLLDLPAAGVEPLRGHFKKFLPPRFATFRERTEETAMLSVIGPRAAALLGNVLAETTGGGLAGVAGSVAELADGDVRMERRGEGDEGEEGDGLHLLATGELAVPAFDLMGPVERIHALREALEEAGGVPAGRAVRETLRIEAGRPAFGEDMDADTIPVEAGIHERAIDYEKGCYTGQEVIVRIRDRGRVNWHLRGLLLGEAPSPAPNTELFREGEERAVGRVTSAAASPRFGQTIALGYVRREVEPPAELRLGEPGGAAVEVRELDGGWPPEA